MGGVGGGTPLEKAWTLAVGQGGCSPSQQPSLLQAYSPGKPDCGLWLSQGFPVSALGECLSSKPRGFFDWAGGRGAMNQGLQLSALQRVIRLSFRMLSCLLGGGREHSRAGSRLARSSDVPGSRVQASLCSRAGQWSLRGLGLWPTSRARVTGAGEQLCAEWAP